HLGALRAAPGCGGLGFGRATEDALSDHRLVDGWAVHAAFRAVWLGRPAAQEDLVDFAVAERPLDDFGRVTRAVQELEPGRATEDALDVTVVDGRDLAAVPQQKHELDREARVRRIRIPAPHEASE